MQRKALVTGATGAAGPALVRLLHEEGWQVRTLSRNAPADGLFPPATQIVLGDVTDEMAVAAAVDGIDVVFHLAALLHINNPDQALEAEYYRVNAGGTRVVAGAARAAGAARVVLFSTIDVYGPTSLPVIHDEDSQCRPRSLYGRTKLEAERIVLSLTRPDGYPLATVLRVAAVYGPNMKGNYRKLARWIRRGLFVPIGVGENRRTLIHERDLARAALLAAVHPASAGNVFNASDGCLHTFREIQTAMSNAVGRCVPPVRVPLIAAKAGGQLVDAVLRVGGASPRALPMLDKMREDMAVSGLRIQRELGFRPAYDLSAGFCDALSNSEAK